MDSTSFIFVQSRQGPDKSLSKVRPTVQALFHALFSRNVLRAMSYISAQGSDIKVGWFNLGTDGTWAQISLKLSELMAGYLLRWICRRWYAQWMKEISSSNSSMKHPRYSTNSSRDRAKKINTLSLPLSRMSKPSSRALIQRDPRRLSLRLTKRSLNLNRC